MNLPAFTPKSWITEITRCINPPAGRAAANPILVEKEAFVTKKEAEAYATAKPKSYSATNYVGYVRSATPKDIAEQRICEIGEALAKELETALVNEKYILAYDTEEFGKLDFATPITSAIEEVLNCYPPDEEDPSGV